LAGRKTASAQAATKQFSRTNAIAISCMPPLSAAAVPSGLLFIFLQLSLILAKDQRGANINLFDADNKGYL
jgi:hypothetical protein